MALKSEWKRRLEMWRKELPKHFYRPLGEVAVEGFVTLDRLTPEQAAKHAFAPMPTGTPWGAKWEYGWFRGQFKLPKEAAGKRIVLNLKVNGSEAMIWINGEIIEACRGPWEHALLTMSAQGDETYDLLTESYAWHGQTPCDAGPMPPGRVLIPEPPAAQQEIGTTTFGVWEEEAWQLHMDVETLFYLREAMEQHSLRVAEIDKGLREYTVIMDFEHPPEKYPEMIRAARARLAPLLACRNGSTMPEMFCFGQAHLDVAWLWPLEESHHKAARTLANTLALIDEYPDHLFLHSQPVLFAMVKQDYPDLYARVKKAVADGNILPEGALWVEADTNVTGGEAMIRQFMHGIRFVREEFGLESQVMWLPDVFGYSAALPQIIRGCGVKYFSTQKIFWNYHGGETFPYHNFLWQGIDGSEVISHLHNDYNSSTRPDVMVDRWRQRVQPDGMSARMVPFGYGDGGGGATREHLEYIRRTGDLEGCPKLRMAGPVAFFEDLVARGEHKLNRYVGELYFQAHRGVLTSQARTKRGNRKGEVALREAEMWGAAAGALAKFHWPAATMDAH
ncbi:MAG: alpha-mannosidase [Planctomycetota bacterium]